MDCREDEVSHPEVEQKGAGRKDIPGSIAFVPSAAGLIIAGEVVKDLTRAEREAIVKDPFKD